MFDNMSIDNRILIHDIKPKTLVKLIKFIYGGKVDLEEENLDELLVAADKVCHSIYLIQ